MEKAADLRLKALIISLDLNFPCVNYAYHSVAERENLTFRAEGDEMKSK